MRVAGTASAVLRRRAELGRRVQAHSFAAGRRARELTLVSLSFPQPERRRASPAERARRAREPSYLEGSRLEIAEQLPHFLLGGLAASGWQTGALTLRLLGDTFLNTIAAGGLGFSNLKWKKPVMVGDTIFPTARIASLRRSAHHPDRGIMSLDLVVKNQRGEEVMTMTLANLVETRQVRP